MRYNVIKNLFQNDQHEGEECIFMYFHTLIAIIFKTAVELVLPAVSIIVYSMINNSFLPEGPNCVGSEKGTAAKA